MDNSAGSGGNGSPNAPLTTIQDGLNAVQPGDTLFIMEGTYSEVVSTSTHGTEPAPITVKAFPNELVTVTGTAGERLQLAGNYWIFEDFVFDQNQVLADAGEIWAHHITLRNMEIHNGRREGISIETAHSIVVENSYIHNFIWLDGSTRRDAHCIMIDMDISDDIHDIFIQRNTIESCSGDGLQIFGETEYDISAIAPNIELIDNTLFIDGPTDRQPGLTKNALAFKAGDSVLAKGNTMTGVNT